MSSYDELPYDTRPGTSTHPDGLFAIGRLHGLQPANVEVARVLEIGCGTGHNLIPIAAALPDALLVGIDLSEVQIALGRESADALGLQNLVLLARDLRELEGEPFDYVICHGVYSWVDEDVREALMAGIASLLAPHGLAYVSWNALPGWRVSGVLRDLLMWRTEGIDPPRAKVAAARAVLTEIIERTSHNTLFGLVQDRARGLMERSSDSYVMHDFLAEHNTPMYYRTFAAHAAKHRLHVLSEAQLGADAVDGHMPDTIEEAQFGDFLEGRSFRRSVLCHRSAEPTSAEPARLAGLFLRTRLRPGPMEGNAVSFLAGETVVMGSDSPLLVDALTLLSDAFPRSLRFEDLAPPDGLDDLALMLFECAYHRFVEVAGRQAIVTADLSATPEVWAPARLGAARGQSWVPNLLHQPVAIDARDAEVLSLLDGTLTPEDLLEELHRRHPEASLSELQAGTMNRLGSLARAALLSR